MTDAGAAPTASHDGARPTSRRWLGVLAVGLVVAAACALLGRWQLTRHEHRAAVAALVAANYDAPVVPLVDLLPTASSPLAPQAEWRPVAVTGRYADGGTVVLRNRPVAGTPAVHVLAPLVVETPDGPAVLVVDRGWLPAGSEAATGGVPAAPTGDVEAVVRLRPPEPVGRAGPPGQTYRIEPAGVLASGAVDDAVRALPVIAAFGVLAEESPAAPDAPRALPPPDTQLGPHLSYAFQWWVFAVGALGGVVVLVRRERAMLEPAAGAPGAAPVGSAAAPPRRRRRPTPEDEEDALIDSQIAAAQGRGRARPS